MEQQRTNWPAWIALGVSLVALIVAFGSMAVSQQSAWRMWTMPGWSNPPQVAPPGWGERGGPGQPMPPGPGLGELIELIRFIDGLLKLAALALLIWLGFKIFRQRRNQPPSTNPPTTPQPPLTPAGHDPRVE